MASTLPRVSVIIPTFRGGIARLKESLDAQTFQDYELIVVQGVSPAARARNLGVAQARADLLLFVDDDAFFGADDVVRRLVDTLEERPNLACVGPAKILPPDANAFQRRVAYEVPRWVYPVQEETIESNPPIGAYGFSALSTTCVLMRRAWHERIGGFDEGLPTGPEDTEYFYRMRQEGARFAVVARAWVCHPPPASLKALVKKSFAYGVGHAIEARREPGRNMQLVPLDRWYGKLLLFLSPVLVPITPFITYYFDPVRSWRFGWRPIKAFSTYATLYGYAYGWFRHPMVRPIHAAPGRATASQSGAITMIAFVAIAILNYIYANVMAWLLPLAAFGVLGIAQAYILTTASLLNAGFPWHLARAISRSRALPEVYAIARSALVGNLGVAALFTMALLVAGATLGLPLGASGEAILFLLGIESLLLALAALWGGVLQGLLRFGALGFGRFIEVALKLLIGIGLVALGWGVEAAVLAIVIGTAISVAALGWQCRHFPFWRATAWAGWGEFRQALVLLAGIWALVAIANLDIIGPALFSTPDVAETQAGLYQGAVIFSRVPILLAGALASALFPYLARAREPELSNYIAGGLRYIMLLIVPISLTLVAIPEAIMGLLLPEVFQESALVLRVTGAASALLAVATMAASVLQARDSAYVPAISMPLVAVAQFIALAALAPAYGPAGAAISLGLAGVLACGSLLVPLTRTYLRARLSLTAMARYGVVTAGFVLLLRSFPHDSGPLTILCLLFSACGYVVMLALARLLLPADLKILVGSVLPADNRWLMAAQNRCLMLIERLNHALPA